MSSVRREDIVELRPMRHADLSGVAAVEQQSYEFPWSQGVFRDCLLAGYSCQVLAHQDVIRGYAILSIAADEAHILNLCVASELRAYGYGSRLLDEMLAKARAANVEQVLLEARPTNTQALQLYLKRGFVRIGVRPAYYQAKNGREDAWVFSLSLKARST